MIQLDGENLTLEDVLAAARLGAPVAVTDAACERMQRAQDWVREIVTAGEPVYGINTGFGVFAEQRISAGDTVRLARNLILSHAVGAGPEFPAEVVRAAMLIRANTLAAGYSGVQPALVETLAAMLNAGVTPVVPSQGSLGSSGDLAPLCHLGLVLTRAGGNAEPGRGDEDEDEAESGLADYQGRRMNGAEAMQAAGLERIVLGPKEGLALSNGATFSAAAAGLAVLDAEHLLRAAEIALAMTLEAVLGVSAAFDERIHLARRHPGQIRVAANLRALIAGSTLIDAAGRTQDAYSLRCAPQIQGAAQDTIDYVRQTLEREINAATDNPLLFGPHTALSGGNFHGEPVGLAADFLTIALSEVAAISERRTFRLTDSRLNAGLPPMLVDSEEAAGLNSGLMMAQYTAASLVLENQTLAHPDSVHSLPTSAEQEDHNANSMTAARHARQVLENCAHVLAIEIYSAARALDLRLRARPQARLGAGTQAAYDQVRSVVPYQPGDAWWGPEIERVRRLVQQPEFVAGAWRASGLEG